MRIVIQASNGRVDTKLTLQALRNELANDLLWGLGVIAAVCIVLSV